MKAWIGVVALVGLAACNHAVADGNDLLKQCQAMVGFVDSEGKKGSSYGAGYCMGVIAGVVGLRSVTNPTFPSEYQTCLPTPSPPTIQAARIAVKFLRDNPEKLNLDDGVLMLMALQRAFPCKN